jgi:hypothetical protein
MKRRLFNLLAGVSTFLFLAGAYVMLRSWIVRDEVLIAKRSLFVAASDSGRIEFAFANCSTATPSYGPYVMSLAKGVPSVYSPNVTLRFTSNTPGSGMLTRDHLGIGNSQLAYYGNLESSSSQPLGPLPLVNDITAVTIPTALVLCLAAVFPSLWLWRLRQRRRFDFDK